MIQEVYLDQVKTLTGSPEMAQSLWQEIELAYAEPDRYFHNLAHLQHMLRELEPLQHEIEDWPTLFFSLCYHDVVYDVAQNAVLSDNEERSAAFAERHLRRMNYTAEKIEKCRQQILATQKHNLLHDNDTNLFTDADLCVLGQSWEMYVTYKNNIRREYQIYPVSIYNAGRRKVLEYFLHMKPLFKTAHFRGMYEKTAKENIQRELQLLKG